MFIEWGLVASDCPNTHGHGRLGRLAGCLFHDKVQANLGSRNLYIQNQSRPVIELDGWWAMSHAGNLI